MRNKKPLFIQRLFCIFTAPRSLVKVARMEWMIISLVALVASGLTLFSGFGLGTILMPAVAIFFPVPVAVAITAVVHLLNNLFKMALLYKDVNKNVLLRFGLPALLAAVPGALLLDFLSTLPALKSYVLSGHSFNITPVKLAAGLLLIMFATAELVPFVERFTKHRHALPLGGALSGFFGGLSGHQGAFRSAFLVQANLEKKAFVATNAAIAIVVDVSRLVIYGFTFDTALLSGTAGLITLATAAAFAGVFIGNRLLKKVTITFIRRLVAVMLYLLGGLLCAGII